MTADRSDMSSRDYEREAEASRHRLAKDLRELTDRLTPGQLMDEMLTYAKGGGGTFLNALSNAAKHNPIPSLLIGAGLMLFLSEKTGISNMIGGHRDQAPDRDRGDRYRDDRRYADEYSGSNAGYGQRGYAASNGNGNGRGIRDSIGGVAAAGANALGGVAAAGRNALGGVADAGRHAAGGIATAGANVAGGAASGMRTAADGVRSAADTALHGARHGVEQAGSALAGAAGAARTAAAGIGAGIAGAGEAIGSGIAGIGSTVAGTADELYHRAQDFGGMVGDRAAVVGDRLYGGARDVGDRVYGGVREAPRKVTDGVNQAKDSLMHLVSDQPLVAGALGLAVGALVAAVLPKTDAEDQLMGETADQVKQAVAGVATEEMEAAKNVATSVASTVANKVVSDVMSEVGKVAEEHGLSAEGAVAAVHTATDKLKQAVGLPGSDDPLLKDARS